MMETDIIILAAGKGTRMKSALPKVLHKLAGKSLLQHVVDSANSVQNANITIVTGHGSDEVRSSVSSSETSSLNYVEQTEQLGTAHAVQMVVPNLGNGGTSLILYGDVPMILPETIHEMLGAVSESNMSLLTVTLDDPTGYGRILRNESGQVTAIIEQKDASTEQLKVREVNTGVLAVKTKQLKQWLPQIDNNNAQGEYYLTDLIAIARSNGVTIETKQPQSVEEFEGVNNRIQLSALERFYQKQQAEALMVAGVTLADPSRIDVRGNLKTGNDSYIDINAVFEGDVTLGSNVSIGPNCHIIDSDIGDYVEIYANSVIEQSQIANHSVIGPFARLRPGTVLAEKAKVGNFVETKNTHVGKGSKINHLSYVGDSELGEGVNVGAGTITCNYDGVNKHKTVMGDNSFIGSNSSLVAPVQIGKNATVGAGSTITKDVPDDELGLTRASQKSISDWHRPTKKSK
jgi:bifunctional UDP-N-acetylglucosamine pyrophosphorylase/glucosamine-1-phosphate N-acetyltransferase